jgi:ATP-dependent protease ClpP protease subunit
MKFLFSIFVGLFLSISAHGQLSFTTYCDIDNGNLKVGGVFNEDMVTCFMDAVAVTPLNKPIHVYMNSPGGVMSAYHSIMKIVKEDGRFKTITCDRCFSAAAFFFELSGLKRIMYEDSILMFHQERVHSNGSALTVKILKEILKEIQKDNNELSRQICKVIKMDVKRYRARTEEDWFVDAKTAKKLCMVDKVIKRTVNGK